MNKNSMLRIYVLKELSHSPKSGYDLLDDLSKYSGGKRQSPGTIYPLLKDLLDTKLISCKVDGRKKNYSLTAKGRKTLGTLTARQATIMQEHTRILKVFSKMDRENKDDIEQAIRLMTKEPIEDNKWIRYNMDVLSTYQSEMLKVISQPFNEKKADRWRARIIKDCQFFKELRQ